MTKKRKRADHPRTPKRPTVVRRAVPRQQPDAESQPLIQELKRRLYGDHPLELLAFVSTLIAATRHSPGTDPDEVPSVELEQLVETFLGTDLAPTTAALHVIAAYSSDELLTARIRQELRVRQQPMPPWLRDLSATEVVGVFELADMLGDGLNYFVDLRLPDGYVMTAVAYVDNNMGRVVKDAFVVEQSFEQMREPGMMSHPDLTLDEPDPADARASLEQAICVGSMTFPPFETDTWPAAQPLLEWAVGLLPAGGAVPQWREWTPAEYDELAEDFLSSRHGAAYANEDHRHLLESLLWLGTSYGVGDPLRFSPISVEILLTDRFPRKVMAPVSQLTLLPELLRAFVRYGHEMRRIAAHLTDDTLGAVDRWEPEYQLAVRTGASRGGEALARLFGAYDDSSQLERAVGGPDQLATLDRQPLPDELFDWADIPKDIAPKIAEILTLCDQNATDLLDVEHRTANRRLLRMLAVAAPSYFRGRAAARTSAAAICWMVAQANDSMGPGAELTTRELLEPFGVASATQRAKKFRDLLGLGEHSPYDGPMGLGTPHLLVSQRRVELIEARDAPSW